MEIVAAERLVLILLVPLAGAALSYLSGSIDRRAPGWVATFASACAALLVFSLFRPLSEAGGRLEQHLFTWMAAGVLNVPFVLRLDPLGAVMCSVVTGVGTLIHLYAIGYMREDAGKARFFAYLNLFLFAMLLLVLGGNLVVLFAGWEGVGLCSYLLIGFWYKNTSFAAAGRKAFVVNRIGDAGFLLGIFLLLQYANTTDFLALAADLDPTMPLALIALCLFIGAVGKSAQIPLFVWLPDAMAGPTPVSALIHAATMVTAGIYMVARMHFLYSAVPAVQAVMLVTALCTALLAASIALAQFDIKKVLAYSTVSQLGFMFAAAAVGAYSTAIFHVITHSFFKACLFLCAGSVILGYHHEQDMRKMGGLSRFMPFTFAAYLFSTISIAGIFPFAGYFSKHAITEAVGARAPALLPYGHLVAPLLTLAAVLTAFYMTRSLVLTFAGRYRGHEHPHEASLVMLAPVVGLALLAAAGGALLAEPLTHYLGGHAESHVLSFGEKVLASWPGLAGCAAGLVVYLLLPELPARVAALTRPLSTLVERRYYVDELYRAIIVAPLEASARLLAVRVDQQFIDRAVEDTAKAAMAGGEAAGALQSGQLRVYALLLFLAVVLLLTFLLVW